MRIVRFDGYEIRAVRDIEDPVWGTLTEVVFGHEAQYWSLYGHRPGRGVEHLKDYPTRGEAEGVKDRLVGKAESGNFVRYEVGLGEVGLGERFVVLAVSSNGVYTPIFEAESRVHAEEIYARITGCQFGVKGGGVESNRYNGWKNYETWAVAMWLDNDQAVNDYWKEAVGQWVHAALEGSTEPSLEEAKVIATLNAARELEASHALAGDRSNVYTGLLTTALSRVDWREIAGHLVDEVEIKVDNP